MPTSLIDSAVFRDIFTTAAMRQVFSDENRVQKYLDFEAALARAQARLGIIPKEAAEEICRHCRAEEIDFSKLKAQTERIGYPVLPVVQQLVALCREEVRLFPSRARAIVVGHLLSSASEAETWTLLLGRSGVASLLGA